MRYILKALSISAFIIFGLPIFSSAAVHSTFLSTAFLNPSFLNPDFLNNHAFAGDCPPPANPQTVAIRNVYDGDTLLLQDGRKVRLIGINTPELGRDGQPDQPLARQATATARQLVNGQTPLLLQLGSQPQDHYGRVLGHLFLANGRSLEAELLKQGLGFAISIPPNLALRDCLNQAEAVARQAKLGVWAEPRYQPVHASTLGRHSGGFGRYQGEISRTGTQAKNPYLELNDRLYLPLQADILAQLARVSSDDLRGRKIEVRGWLIARELSQSQKKRGFLPFMLKVNHLDNIQLCNPYC